MEYFVNGNLKHNHARYKWGDTVELTDEAAQPLLAIGVITSDAPAEPETIVDAPEPEIEQKPEPKVGGEVIASGEPSLDGAEPEVKTEAVDVTPVVDAPEPEIDPSLNL